VLVPLAFQHHTLSGFAGESYARKAGISPWQMRGREKPSSAQSTATCVRAKVSRSARQRFQEAIWIQTIDRTCSLTRQHLLRGGNFRGRSGDEPRCAGRPKPRIVKAA